MDTTSLVLNLSKGALVYCISNSRLKLKKKKKDRPTDPPDFFHERANKQFFFLALFCLTSVDLNRYVNTVITISCFEHNTACANNGARCNCDATGTGSQTDSGWVTDHSLLPVRSVYISGVDDTGDSADFRVSSLQCSDSSSSIYPSCAALKEAGLLLRDGRYLIDPDGVDTGLPPFIVRCDSNTGKYMYFHCFSRPVVMQCLNSDKIKKRCLQFAGHCLRSSGQVVSATNHFEL